MDNFTNNRHKEPLIIMTMHMYIQIYIYITFQSCKHQNPIDFTLCENLFGKKHSCRKNKLLAYSWDYYKFATTFVRQIEVFALNN